MGYHYGFADFISDEKYLKETYNIHFSRDHETNIRKVLEGRTDISIVTKSYLNLFLAKHPQFKNQLIISEKVDQEYNHRVLITKDSLITDLEINDLFDMMRESGILKELWEEYGME